MSAHSPRFVLRSIVSFVTLAIVVAQAAPALAASIQTDLWVYQNGDSVTVVGDGFGPLETVELVTTDPSDVEVDRGTTTTDELGYLSPSYQFVLHATDPGIYDVVATGQDSGVTAATQFDPASLTITGKSPNAGSRPWFRTVAGGFDVTVSGGYACSTGGSGNARCASPSTLVVDVLGSDGANATVTPPALATKTISSLSGGVWTTTFQFRSSPGAGQFPIPTDGLFDVRAVFTWNVVGGGTSSATDISDDHLGVDNVAPLSSVTSVSGTGSANVSASGTASDALSGLATGASVHLEIRQGSVGGALVAGTSTDVNPAGNGNWSYSTVNGPTVPGTYCVISAATDRAGNVQSAVGNQCYSIVVSDTTAPTVTIQVTTNGGTPNGNNGWYTTNVNGTVSATDAGSNISALNCSGITLTGVTGVGTAKIASGSFSITTDGTSNISCTATDSAPSPNTSASSTLTIKRDATAPVISTRPAGDSCSLPGSLSWCRGSQTAGFSVTDATSGTNSPCTGAGGASCNFTRSSTTNGSAVTIASGNVADLAGNTASSINSAAFKIDSEAPVISTRPLGDSCSLPGSGGWCRGTQTAGFSVADGTSGISTPCVAAGGASCDFTASTVTNGSAVVVGSGPVTDLAGNTASLIDSAAFKIDSQAPTVSATLGRGADSNGWYNHPVTVTYNGVDNGPSGGVTCDVPVTYSGPDSATASETGSCSDAAGNSASATSLFKYDGTGPGAIATPSRPADSNGWYNHPFSVSFSTSGTDLSDNVTCSSLHNYTDPDDSAGTVSGTCTDDAGNSTTATFHFKYDATAPGVTVTADRTPDHNGWHNEAVVFSTEGSDLTSGLVACDLDQTYSGPEGISLEVSGTCTDLAGNVGHGTSPLFDYDATAPDVTVTPDRGPDYNGWYNQSVMFDTNGTDGTSGIASCDLDQTHSSPDGTGLTVSGDCTDNAGNSATGTSDAFDFDATAPSISAALDKSPAATGWFNGDTGAPTVNYLCSDAMSGLDDACPASHLFGNGADQAHSRTIHDLAGNAASASVSDVDVDLIDPSISAALDHSAAGSGWFNIATGAPIEEFTCSDTGSSDLSSCPSDHPFGEGANQSYSDTAYDNAGNSASAGVTGVSVDLATPVISTVPANDSCSLPGNNSWCRGTQTAGFSASDATSGVSAPPCVTAGDSPCDLTKSTATNGSSVKIASGSVTDVAGNTASSIDSATFKIDSLTPDVTVTPDRGPDHNGWYNHSVVFDTNGTDGTSGIASCDGDRTYSSPDGSSMTVSGSCIDNAGNPATGTSAAFDYDATAPTMTAALDLSPALTGWFNHGTGAPTVNYVCNDATSGLDASCPTSHLFANGKDQSHSRTIHDLAGNAATAGVTDVDVDTADPSISAALDRAPAASGWFNISTGAPRETFACSDTGSSDLKSCAAAYQFGEGANQSHSGTAEDNAGNTASATVSSVNVDLTAPSVAFSDCPALVVLGSTGTVAWSASDSLSGVDGGATGTVALDTTGPGPKTVTKTVYDVAGNTRTASCTYAIGQVVFSAPIDGPSVINNAKAGRVIPVKAQIIVNGTAVTSGYVSILVNKLASCPSGAEDSMETYASPGSSFTANQFTYDAAAGRWQYNLDTSAQGMSAPNCYRGNVYLGGIKDIATGKISGGNLAGHFLIKLSK